MIPVSTSNQQHMVKGGRNTTSTYYNPGAVSIISTASKHQIVDTIYAQSEGGSPIVIDDQNPSSVARDGGGLFLSRNNSTKKELMISVKDTEMVGENIIKFDTEGTNSQNNLITVPPAGINNENASKMAALLMGNNH